MGHDLFSKSWYYSFPSSGASEPRLIARFPPSNHIGFISWPSSSSAHFSMAKSTSFPAFHLSHWL